MWNITLLYIGHNICPDDLSSWRHFTLTNTNYEIFIKPLTLGLQKVIKSKMNLRKSGFVMGTNISPNDITKYACKELLVEVVVSLDYKMPFGSAYRKTYSHSSVMDG